ncbi:hypothetical protein CRD60_08455, partial [Bifidobacterium aemilianum]
DGTYTWNDGGTHTYSWSNQGSYSNTSWTTAGGAGTFAYSGTIINKALCQPGIDTIAACFPDANFARGIASLYGKSISDTFTLAMQKSTTNLDLGNKAIADITGVELLTEIQTLYLDHNQISDLTPINPNNATWPRLKWLDATGQSIHVTPTP